ncbi:Acyl- N-acyltransferase protein [Rutstroemia sp. NJR-2017a BVV2]|nr:Acyl- N-acyltransferase protein [Rutstroemia sp. NJR-2017a BVV2]PQE21817.1 Acyl- N-acyltransferase protein [Rutstroemia sp. NJR-2017a BVV2]
METIDLNFYLETPRLVLSYFDPNNQKHHAFLVTLYNSPLFISSEGQTEIVNVEKARERISNRFIAEHEQNGYGQFLVSVKTSLSTPFSEAIPIGSVGLTKSLDDGAFDIPDIGFAMIPEMNGMGYATESAQCFLDYVHRKQGLDIVFGIVGGKDNRASCRVMEKLGMKDLGVQSLHNDPARVFVSSRFKDLKKYKFK